MWLRILRLRNYPGSSGWALNVTTSVLIRERQREIIHTQKSRKQCENRGRNWSDVATSKGMPAAARSWKNRFSTRASRERSPSDTLILTQWAWCWTIRLQKCERINFCCFKPLILWHFAMAALGNEYTPGVLIIEVLQDRSTFTNIFCGCICSKRMATNTNENRNCFQSAGRMTEIIQRIREEVSCG